jgi:hypothetical protein
VQTEGEEGEAGRGTLTLTNSTVSRKTRWTTRSKRAWQ